MPRPYRLLLVSNDKPESPEGIFLCGQMMGWGLWTEFSKLSHVTLEYQNADAPLTPHKVDCTLLHAYFQSPIFKEYAALRRMTRRVANLMEIDLMPQVAQVDKNFTYLPIFNTTYIPFPCLKSLLDSSLPKQPGSVLFDHSWRGPRCWLPRLYDWFAPLAATRKIGQLRREEHEEHPVPGWIQSIPQSSYLDYLRATAPFETFVMTHPGTYEHSVVDMAYRGIRVLVPQAGGTTFAPRDVVRSLNLETFSTQAELMSLLAKPAPPAPRPELFTDLSEVVHQIDAYFQEVL